MDEDLINELASFDDDTFSKKIGNQAVFFMGDEEPSPYKASEVADNSISVELLAADK